ncbi:DMT family transporter [Geothrix sp. 21YS21S-2]|uniref:DMT family transporter n=1 Tax=Geothrix sp. 21YS21S-2 TaxID=3068893 RepID=UPI0027B9A8AD|nr:DMT family transporter [Geothrix sp. 21YS21S-2]
MAYAGELAALATSLCWAFNSVCFTVAGRRVGSQTVNAARLYMALAMLVGVHLAAFGTAFPFHAGAQRLVPLAVSGLIGFALGDALLFEAFLLLGARVAMLLMTLSPVFSVILARVFLGQSLGLPKVVAILATLAGIAWVVAEGHGESQRPKHATLGVLLGIGGALGQSVGLILSDVGMRGGFHPVSANLVRVVAGTLAISVWFLLRGQFLDCTRRMKDMKASIYIFAGAITGPVIGVVLSLFAITHTSMGVAATLMSLSPVLLLPISMAVFKERVSSRAWAGTILSIVGAAALFWI